MSSIVKATASELEILKVLWEKGECTVREVHDVLEQTKDAGYTTTLKLMQIMLEKKMISRKEAGKSHLYKAEVSKNNVQGQMIRGMIDNMFNGSASQLVMRALGTYEADAAELDEIRKYLDEIEKKKNS
jgi:predicted transcriptional regulator